MLKKGRVYKIISTKPSNNNERSVANAKYYRNQKLGIDPVAPAKKTALEELLDQTFLNELAYKNLRTLIEDSDAAAVLDKLQHDGDVETFNSFFLQIQKGSRRNYFHISGFFQCNVGNI